ncbi:Imidazolonepropionase [Cupriavidus campinensis]|uniref:Imidazolonepropionase n=1 Tax=Cupriavidus campinensis TaxID=151783 RepID=A0ABY3EMS0_9BURK|nr:imidazolonepropionase [Cupriavidus campinensis]TSP12268.1 imidazolonepropionase [Cupriavidus campinensis]CAG2149165.1 Imidazolonepropionase [Cupriavidus campinensis]
MTISHAPSADGVWHHCHLLPEPGQDTALRDGAIVVADGRIVWLGTHAALPDTYRHLPRHDAGGAWITPGLVDCHTHLVYGGQRADEFAMRLAGASYEEIARAGGGIVSTVRATREADEDTLFAQAAGRLRPLLAEGVTAIEIKSGYGLSLDAERKQLRVARRLGTAFGVTVHTTFLGAHALPPEYAGRADDYIDLVCDTMLPALAGEGLVDAVDAFCEGIGFSPAQTRRVFEAAARHGLPVKLHAEQLSNLGGAALAASHQALSADHLEHLDEAGVRAMAAAGTVAVLLPGAYYFLRDTHLPPLALLREHGVRIALATDHNPGTSPTTSLLLMMNMACTLFRMTVPEVLAGVTTHAAHALGAADRHGTLAAGRVADFVLWQVATPAELAYWFGRNPCAAVVRQGRIYPTETGAGAKA